MTEGGIVGDGGGERLNTAAETPGVTAHDNSEFRRSARRRSPFSRRAPTLRPPASKRAGRRDQRQEEHPCVV